MATAKFKITINDQIVAITQRSAKLRKALEDKLAPESTEELKALENSLTHVSEALVPFEQQYSHLRALAGIGQIVNSTLEIDEVLQVVMDTIIRLTEAERGFLMLRDEQGEMSIRIARNWEKESINQNESSISRSIVQKVIESGEGILTIRGSGNNRALPEKSAGSERSGVDMNKKSSD